MLKTVSSITNAIGALNFKGTWNASTNTPTIVSGVGVKGDYFVVSVAGSTTIDGISNWGVGDWITYNGTVWQRVEGGADLNGVNLSVSGTTTLSGLTASTSLALDASKNVISVANVDVQYLVIGGGAGGANNGAGGGGAGGYRCNVTGEFSGGNSGSERQLILTTGQAYTVTVGAGGGNSNSGNASVLGAIRSHGGAAGGGGRGATNSGIGAVGGNGQGYQGGNGGTNSTGGGGGGAANYGANGSGNNPGAGGAGLFSSITGSSTQRAGGGGGGRHMDAGSGGAGGAGGGGAGGDYNASAPARDGVAGTVNTGGGGGGGGGRDGLTSGIGAAGGSGLVVIKIPSTFTATFSAGVTETNSTAGGFTTHIVTATSTTSETVTFS